MPCTSPLKVYKKPGGGIAFNSKEGWGDLPFELPCGQCMHCRVKKQRDWAIRVTHEAQMTKPKKAGEIAANSFVTLTYNPENLPYDGGLDVKDWQGFAKRLRARCGPFRFFHCGEYGMNDQAESEKGRPHYHAILFGQDFREDRKHFKGSGEEQLFTSEVLSSCWGKGFSTVGSVSYSSANYVAGYVLKKIGGERAKDHYCRPHPVTGEMFDVNPEYVTMSRNPGLGSTWFDKYKDDVYPSDEVVMNGRRYSVPRYYALRMEKEDSELYELIKEKARRSSARFARDLTPSRLKVMDEVLRAKVDRARK